MKRQRRKQKGRPLPPATDAEFTAEAMRAWAENEGRKWWRDNAPPDYKNILEAKAPEDLTDA